MGARLVKDYMMSDSSTADICFILEGTYPYVAGGVANWAHELIQQHSHFTFHILAILPPDSKTILKYHLPKNVIALDNLFLQNLPQGDKAKNAKRELALLKKLNQKLQMILKHRSKKHFSQFIELFNNYPGTLGADILINSQSAWQTLVESYHDIISDSSFLNFFWSWRAFLSSLYSLILAPIPAAKTYHSTCTGYAGLLLARAHLETGKPCLLTEHGIYTNERRIEIISADWLMDPISQDLLLNQEQRRYSLQNLWLDMFSAYEKICYDSCEKIISLYTGNARQEIAHGADENKVGIIPNGIDYDTFSKLEKVDKEKPVIALIGRVVPIKDIKTFIRAIDVLYKQHLSFEALILGPCDEDEEYFYECEQIVEQLGLQSVIEFAGKVNVKEYLKKIDILVLTSISEAQPLVILEAGACGVVTVATDVGACREMLYGREDEQPALGQCGEICDLANPKSIASAITKLLNDKSLYQQYSQGMQQRVKKYYHKNLQVEAYEKIYRELTQSDTQYQDVA
jgi:glycosyltransferase involved in cell wall biosynthesis